MHDFDFGFQLSARKRKRNFSERERKARLKEQVKFFISARVILIRIGGKDSI